MFALGLPCPSEEKRLKDITVHRCKKQWMSASEKAAEGTEIESISSGSIIFAVSFIPRRDFKGNCVLIPIFFFALHAYLKPTDDFQSFNYLSVFCFFFCFVSSSFFFNLFLKLFQKYTDQRALWNCSLLPTFP